MKTRVVILAAFILVATVSAWAYTEQQKQVKQVRIDGYVGKRIDDCIARRVKAQDVDELVAPFRLKNEDHLWETEFWGKWIQGAIGSYRYTHDATLYKIIKDGANSLMATQMPSGYIGDYAPGKELGDWDVWGRKYVTLGLIGWYDLSGDAKALKAARHEIDYTMTQIGAGKKNITEVGLYRGMASSSILEPVVLLYNRTKDQRYLDFAKYIVAQWETPSGPQLIGKADVPVALRFPRPSKWWYTAENGQKAYEMMSCYEGLLELYKVTGQKSYLDAVEKIVSHINNEEINIAGSGSSHECWYSGRSHQTYPTYKTMETCVTFTWMQLCNRLLRVTGNPIYADYIERSLYNALMSSFKGDGSEIVKYSPLEGVRIPGENQCGVHINCCNANGPRAFALIPMYAYIVHGDTVNVNLYAPSEVKAELGKQEVTITQQTTYPVGDSVDVIVGSKKAAKCAISFRIPSWSKVSSIEVNGEKQQGVEAGTYYTVSRTWKAGDKVKLHFDMRGRVTHLNNCFAIERGPVVLARDSRFGDGYVDEAAVVKDADGYVELTPVKAPTFAWMAFTIKAQMGTDFNEDLNDVRDIHLCDLGSAGNTWDKSQRYRVWIPETLDITKPSYKP
jgi:DUF1680 family protein